MLIIFDLDDTLIDTSGTILPVKLELIFCKLVELGCIKKNQDQALEELKRINSVAKNTKSALEEFFAINDIDPKHLVAVFEILQSDIKTISISQIDYAKEVLSQIAQHHMIGLVSAGEYSLQMDKLKCADLPDRLFSRIVICHSHEKGMYYQQLLQDFACKPSEVIVCGDRIEQDLSPAKSLGITTVHIKQGRGLNQQTAKFDVDYSISSLKELLDILKKIESKNQLGNI